MLHTTRGFRVTPGGGVATYPKNPETPPFFRKCPVGFPITPPERGGNRPITPLSREVIGPITPFRGG